MVLEPAMAQTFYDRFNRDSKMMENTTYIIFFKILSDLNFASFCIVVVPKLLYCLKRSSNSSKQKDMCVVVKFIIEFETKYMIERPNTETRNKFDISSNLVDRCFMWQTVTCIVGVLKRRNSYYTKLLTLLRKIRSGRYCLEND